MTDIEKYCNEIINGTGGLHDFEYYEMATSNVDRDVAVAIWAVKCLGNDPSPEARAVVDAIVERRGASKREQQNDESSVVKIETLEVSKDILTELKNGIIEAISSEDGLDGADGTHLLAHLNTLLGLPVDDYGMETVEPDWPEYAKIARQRYLDLLNQP